MSTDERSGLGTDPVRVPGAATAGRHLRLVWRANLRAQGFRGPMVRFALIAVVVTVGLSWLDPILAVCWILGVAACLAMTAWANTVLWRRGLGDRSVAIIRPGGIEFVAPSSSAWYPSARIERWVFCGPALVLQLSGHGRTTLDVAGLDDAARAAVTRLLAADEEPDLATPWRDVASWVATEATVKQARSARVGLVGDRWARILPSALIVFGLLLGLRWIVRWLSGRAALGSAEAARAALGELPSFAITAAVITVIWIGLSMWSTYRRADRRAVGVRTVILGTDEELAVFAGTATVTRFRWSAVATCRTSPDWFEIVTDRPFVTSAVPTWAFFEGERDRAVRAFERSRAERG